MRAESGEDVVPNCNASIHLCLSASDPARNTFVANPAGLQHNPEISCIKSTFSCICRRIDLFGIAIISTTNAVDPSSGASRALSTVPYPCIVLNPRPQNKCDSYNKKCLNCHLVVVCPNKLAQNPASTDFFSNVPSNVGALGSHGRNLFPSVATCDVDARRAARESSIVDLVRRDMSFAELRRVRTAGMLAGGADTSRDVAPMASSIGIGIRSSAAVAGAASIVAAGDREPMRDVRSCVRARGGRSVGAFDARAARSRVGVNWISESSSLLVLTLVASQQCRSVGSSVAAVDCDAVMPTCAMTTMNMTIVSMRGIQGG